MDLGKLTSKLKEIPFEKWKINQISEWNKYTTEINNQKIQINYLPPKNPTDDMRVHLNIFSPENEIIAEKITPPGIYRFVLDLQYKEIKRLEEKNYNYKRKKFKENQKNLPKFLNSI